MLTTFCTDNENMMTKKKVERRKKGKSWIKSFTGSNLLHAYKRKFKIPISTAINDLESFGVKLDQREIASVRINLHYDNVQQIPKGRLMEYENLLDDEKKQNQSIDPTVKTPVY